MERTSLRHAFLLMAHNNYALVGRIMRKLDHPDNAIYIHIDAKSLFTQEDAARMRACCQHSAVYFVEPRVRVTWGGYSQIECQLRLLETALREGYDYYHYLSGVDFPIKSMAYIHDFFSQHAGCEFVHFCDDEFTQNMSGRFAQYHYLQEKAGRDKKKLVYWVEKASVLLQRKLLRIDRRKKHPEINFKSGSNWCSITHAFSLCLLSKEALIRELFGNGSCCDEHFIQTILYNSPFVENLYNEKYCISGYDACVASTGPGVLRVLPLRSHLP